MDLSSKELPKLRTISFLIFIKGNIYKFYTLLKIKNKSTCKQTEALSLNIYKTD